MAYVAALCFFVAAMLDPGPLLLVLGVVCLGLGKAFGAQVPKAERGVRQAGQGARSENDVQPLSSMPGEDAP